MERKRSSEFVVIHSSFFLRVANAGGYNPAGPIPNPVGPSKATVKIRQNSLLRFLSMI